MQAQCSDNQSDVQSLRKELLQAEQIRLDLEADKQSLRERIKFLEVDKGKVASTFGHLISALLWPSVDRNGAGPDCEGAIGP